MTEWRDCKFGEIATFSYGKMPNKKNIVNCGYPIFSGYKIVGYYNSYMYEDPQLIIVARGVGGTGDVKISPPKSYITNLSIIAEVHPGKANKKFLYYYFKINNLRELDSGSAQSQITINDLNNYCITLPPLPEQKAIAEVLSSLDDKIDLLTRQNKTLEDIAQAYFRKWFIEDASDEWEIKKLRDFGEIICGKTPPTTNKKFFNGNIPFIKIPDMHNNVYIFDTADTLSEMGAKYQENKFIPPMSICVSCIATVGLVSMNVFLSQTNQQINSLIPKHDKYRYYLFLFLRSYRDELLALGSGGTMTLNINKTLFGDIECYCPDDEILFRFNNVVNPLFGKIYNNCKQIRILSKLRNTLLPKLISGEIRVKM
jgi:type I restriction enzyme S subunit